MRTALALLTIGILVSGCNGTVTDYVTGVRPPGPGAPASNNPNSELASVKVSPGRVISSAPGLSMDATVTPTRRTLSTGDMSAVVTINRTRVSP